MLFSFLWIPIPLLFVISLIGYLIYKNLPKTGSVNGKVVVITGASSGIGEELALQFAKHQTKLVLAARRTDKLNDIKSRCEKLGAQVHTVQTDVSKEEECKKLIESSVEKFGAIDLLICNAGIGQSFFLEAVSGTENFKEFMDVNYWGCVYPTYYALPHLRKTNGRIAIISSMGGLVPFPRQTLYNSTKHALQGFYDTLRTELSTSKVTITICNPGFIKTAMTTGSAIGRDGKPMGNTGSKSSSSLMITADVCAKILVDGIIARKRSVIVPAWYNIFPIVKFFAPELLDWYLIKFIAGKRRAEKTE